MVLFPIISQSHHILSIPPFIFLPNYHIRLDLCSGRYHPHAYPRDLDHLNHAVFWALGLSELILVKLSGWYLTCSKHCIVIIIIINGVLAGSSSPVAQRFKPLNLSHKALWPLAQPSSGLTAHSFLPLSVCFCFLSSHSFSTAPSSWRPSLTPSGRGSELRNLKVPGAHFLQSTFQVVSLFFQ